MKRLVLLFFLCATLGRLCHAQSNWKYLGPDGGRFNRVDPVWQHSGLWYASVDAQLYVTHDNARSWKQQIPPDSGPIYGVLVHPLTSRLLVLGQNAKGNNAVWESKD